MSITDNDISDGFAIIAQATWLANSNLFLL